MRKKSVKIILFVSATLILAMWSSFTIKNALKLELSPGVRDTLSGEFVDLPDGVIGYEWAGPANGPVLVLVHGFSMSRFAFDNNVQALTGAGFRVLRYDHYGRGASDRPDLVYDAELYDRELLHLLDALGINTRVHLLGYSMGGGIAAVFAGRHPERVAKLVLTAPIGFMPEPRGLQALALVPGLGDWLMAMIGESRLRSAVQKQADDGVAPAYFPELYQEQMRYRGYTRALLSSMRNFTFEDLREDYAALGRSKIPTLLVWGTEDVVVPFAGHKGIQNILPGVRFAAVDEAGHAIAYSHPTIFNRLVIDFLR